MEKEIIIFVIPHCSTERNEKGLIQGTNDYPLTANGYEEAKILSKCFEDIKLDCIYSGPQIRMKQTAKEICNATKKESIIIIDKMGARCYGKLEDLNLRIKGSGILKSIIKIMKLKICESLKTFSNKEKFALGVQSKKDYNKKFNEGLKDIFDSSKDGDIVAIVVSSDGIKAMQDLKIITKNIKVKRGSFQTIALNQKMLYKQNTDYVK